MLWLARKPVVLVFAKLLAIVSSASVRDISPVQAA
jgi:hypothetical protein